MRHVKMRHVKMVSSEALPMIDGRARSSCTLEIHICWNVLREDKIDPPIHIEYFHTGGVREGRCWPKSQTPHSRKRTGGLAPNRPTKKMM